MIQVGVDNHQTQIELLSQTTDIQKVVSIDQNKLIIILKTIITQTIKIFFKADQNLSTDHHIQAQRSKYTKANTSAETDKSTS